MRQISSTEAASRTILGLFIRVVFIENMAPPSSWGCVLLSQSQRYLPPRAWNRRDCRFSDHGSTNNLIYNFLLKKVLSGLAFLMWLSFLVFWLYRCHTLWFRSQRWFWISMFQCYITLWESSSAHNCELHTWCLSDDDRPRPNFYRINCSSSGCNKVVNCCPSRC